MSKNAITKTVSNRYRSRASRYFNVILPTPLANVMGISRTYGVGKKMSTPMKLNRKWAMAILIAALELNMAAMKAVMVVPTLAPRINGAAARSVTTFFATRGTTREVTIELV